MIDMSRDYFWPASVPQHSDDDFSSNPKILESFRRPFFGFASFSASCFPSFLSFGTSTMAERVDEESGTYFQQDNDNHHEQQQQQQQSLLHCCCHRSSSSSSSSALNPSNPAPLPALSNRQTRTHERLKKMQWWMDESVQICGRPMGLDPFVGLLPFVGDCASALVSLVLVAKAAPDLNRYTVVRMLVNVWIDAVVGTVPLMGDVFDVGWKANQRNVAIFEDHMKQGDEARKDMDRRWLITVVTCFFVFCFLCTLATIALTVVVILYIVRAVNKD